MKVKARIEKIMKDFPDQLIAHYLPLDISKVYQGCGKKGKALFNALVNLNDVDGYCMSPTHHVFQKYKDTKKSKVRYMRYFTRSFKQELKQKGFLRYVGEDLIVDFTAFDNILDE